MGEYASISGNTIKNTIIKDLEALTGKLINGDITPLVYELLEGSPYLLEFVKTYNMGFTEEREYIVYEQGESTDTDKDSNARPSFEDWLAEHGKLVTI